MSSTDGRLGVVGLVARREIVVRWGQKGFRVGLLVTLVLIALAALLPKFLGGSSSRSDIDVAIVGPVTSGTAAAVTQLARSNGVTVHLHTGSDPEQARKLVDDGTWDAALIDDTRILAHEASSASVAFVQAGHAQVVGVDRLSQAGLSSAQIRVATAGTTLPVSTKAKTDTAQRQAIASITVVLLFGQLIGFCTWVAMGVVEEKSSRVVELIVSTVRPWQLLAGKLLGIGALAFAQIVAIGAVGLGVALGFGSVDLPADAVGAVVLSFVWFLLGFAFFSALAAALAALVSRQEEVSGVLAPMTGLLLVSYLVAFAVIGSPNSAWSRVLSVLPPVSAITMPARMARGGVPLVDIVASAVLLLAAAGAVVLVGARIYRAAVLHTGAKVSLRRAWAAEPSGHR